MRVFKAILVLVVLGAVGLVAYAYLGDLSPDEREMSQPVAIPGADHGN